MVVLESSNIILAAIVFVLIIIVALIVNGIEDYSKGVKVSIEESLSNVEVPVISLVNNGRTLNFLVDSGANLSIIDSGILQKLKYKSLDTEGTVYGLEGNKQAVHYVEMTTSLGDRKFEETFQVLDMAPAFYRVFETSGVRIHGVLGNSFFTKYKCKIDFNNYIFYIK